MDPMMMLVVGWTLVGGFVFTMIATCLSLVGWVKFADRSQQKKLFLLLIVELVVGLGAKAMGAVTLDASAVEQTVEDKGRNAGVVETITTLTAAPEASGSIDRAQVDAAAALLRPVPGLTSAQDIDDFRASVRTLPPGKVRAEDAASLRESELATKTRLFVRRPR